MLLTKGRPARPAGFLQNMDLDQTLKEYAQQLKRFFLSRVRNPADADDLVQEVLRKTLIYFGKNGEPEKFRPWLFSVARNTLVDHYRKSAKYVNDDLLSRAREPDDAGEIHKQLSKCVRPFLKQLPRGYRHVLEETELNGKSQKQLAEELGVSYSTLKSRVQRGRGILKKLFGRCCQYEFDARGGVIGFRARGTACGTKCLLFP